MCGIAGFTEPVGDRQACLALAHGMLDTVSHRGPEGANAVMHGRATLGHCALPFTDPVHAGQPVLSASGRTAMVFNGEIYNHAELRHLLRSSGLRLSTECDTEVLVELYERDGLRMLDRVRGMFAFAAHDLGSGRLVLARDPFGKKPLFYARSPHGVIFGSELTAVLQHPACERDLDVCAVADYLTLSAFPAPRTAVRAVVKVRPGSYVEFAPGAVQEAETVYWRPTPPPGRPRMPLPVAEKALEDVLVQAVERRLNSTGDRLGVLLSGGVDSGMVAAVAQRLSGARVPTFSAGFADPAFDESATAQSVARYLGTEHHQVRLTAEDLADVFTTDVAQLDEPLADPSLLPTLLVCRQARREVRGVLTGDGADEALLGYRFFQAERVLELVDRILPSSVARALPGLLGPPPAVQGNLPARAALHQLVRGLQMAPERRFAASTAPFAPAELARLLSPDAVRSADRHRPFAAIDELCAAAGRLSPMERSRLGIVAHFLQDVILTKVDRGAMLNSLEPRSPFLDVDLVDFCAGLSPRQKLHGFTGKYLLRRVATRWLPRDVAWGPKLGFRAPVAALLRGPLLPVLQDRLSVRRLDRHGLFRSGEVSRLVGVHLAGRADHSRKIWSLLCFQVWHDEVFSRPALSTSLPISSLEAGLA